MNYTVRFTKATGAGNDFVVLDNREGALHADIPLLARLLCSRHFGVGADGVLIIGPSNVADFSMGYYNADGSTGGMCGNGGRCLARYAYERGVAGPEMRFEAFGHIYAATVTTTGIRLCMKLPLDLRQSISLTRGTERFTASYVNTGSPHTVIFVDDIEKVNVLELGLWVRHHPEFAPLGTNANFVQTTGPESIRLRTYERGVETETMACGTGSVASAYVYHLAQGSTKPVRVRVRSGEDLLVHVHENDAGELTSIELEGSASILFDGTTLVDMTGGKLLSTMQPQKEQGLL